MKKSFKCNAGKVKLLQPPNSQAACSSETLFSHINNIECNNHFYFIILPPSITVGNTVPIYRLILVFSTEWFPRDVNVDNTENTHLSIFCSVFLKVPNTIEMLAQCSPNIMLVKVCFSLVLLCNCVCFIHYVT